ncbi:Fe-Mn family superoxide dismutase [Candidatus Micrarchaeota archaeon]|nr:Fe-Mn family superoxide dismutase [Candidatus Micrarchaeota archaeon]
MNYSAKNFESLLGIEGMSEPLLKNHFTLYQGYVNNTNKLSEILSTKDQTTPEFAELKRRFGWEFNGMRLHELYFENIKKGGLTLKEDSKLHSLFVKNFGSFEKWESDFRAIAGMRGIGWVILYQDNEKLFNCWINEHDVGHLSSAKPLLVVDVFEHAYMLDYGLKKADYINAFFKSIDWELVEKRIEL